jgi:predicted XRE-type DNA-binding protein
MSKHDDDFELIRGSGNIYRDFGHPDADVRQAKAILAAQIIGILDDEGLSTRKAQARTGVNQAEFVRIRNAQLRRFTIDRLMTILNKLGRQVDLKITMRPPSEIQQTTDARVAWLKSEGREEAPR